MKLLVIGSGGREHALAWKLGQSPHVDRVFVAPGNAGTRAKAENVDISPTDFPRLIKFAKQNEIGLTVVGPGRAAARGIVDAFEAEKLRIFGPARRQPNWKGARFFARTCCATPTFPRPTTRVFRNADHAITFLQRPRGRARWWSRPTDWRPAKACLFAPARAEAIDAVKRIARKREFGEAGNQIVIEERLDGQEASVLAITDGRTIVTLPPAQDHKRAYDGDTGPNTGGMGAYCPAPLVTDEMLPGSRSRCWCRRCMP